MRISRLDHTFGDSAPRSPDSFYRLKASEAWPSIDPYIMSRTELDTRIKAGIELYEKYFPPKDNGIGFGEFVAIVAVCAIGAAAVAAAGTASAAGGAGAAAAQAGAASGATASASASGALAVGTASSPAIAAGSSGVLSASGAAALGQQAFSIAKDAAPYARKIGKLYNQATGSNDADKLIKAAQTVESSPNITDAAVATFQAELRKRGMQMNRKDAKAALRERIKREQKSYAAWMRRRAEQLQNQNPDVHTSATKSWIKWLPIATPFVMWAMR